MALPPEDSPSVVSFSFLYGLQQMVLQVAANIPMEPHRSDIRTKPYRKRGRRGGICLRLKSVGLSDRRKLPALATVLLSNMQSIRNKLDELEVWAKLKRKVKESCVLAFTETWLK